MQTRQLGNSDLHITPVGYGAWAIGGGNWEFGWGNQDVKDSIAAIQQALDLGINWIDTAAVYGLGHSEEVVAAALKGRSQQPYVFTKCSLIWDEQGNLGRSLKADSIRNELENSLRRLQLETIDLYQIHWPNPDPDIEEGWSTLAALQKEGKVRSAILDMRMILIKTSGFNVYEWLKPAFCRL
ncbi:MAG TPA: aldo/keto reductase [Leptolyngbyaceae cyanobacterium M33_DOE_097]|uniref:Aldo/keto reductase n=1 Tax=Oscillatoriales cyanobacterium SpSt-418 TaxID=2282169 RepID=A0A7C3PMN1_9CYAN|nr:aldo/keto reductase [Leptolyngbyaceae cyanobacterium M33_DOE_097]